MGRDAYISFRGAAGPIVMNTDAELEQAYAELRNGTFIKQRDQWDGTLRQSREDERSNELDACTGPDTRR